MLGTTYTHLALEAPPPLLSYGAQWSKPPVSYGCRCWAPLACGIPQRLQPVGGHRQSVSSRDSLPASTSTTHQKRRTYHSYLTLPHSSRGPPCLASTVSAAPSASPPALHLVSSPAGPGPRPLAATPLAPFWAVFLVRWLPLTLIILTIDVPDQQGLGSPFSFSSHPLLIQLRSRFGPRDPEQGTFFHGSHLSPVHGHGHDAAPPSSTFTPLGGSGLVGCPFVR